MDLSLPELDTPGHGFPTKKENLLKFVAESISFQGFQSCCLNFGSFFDQTYGHDNLIIHAIRGADFQRTFGWFDAPNRHFQADISWSLWIGVSILSWRYSKSWWTFGASSNTLCLEQANHSSLPGLPRSHVMRETQFSLRILNEGSLLQKIQGENCSQIRRILGTKDLRETASVNRDDMTYTVSLGLVTWKRWIWIRSMQVPVYQAKINMRRAEMPQWLHPWEHEGDDMESRQILEAYREVINTCVHRYQYIKILLQRLLALARLSRIKHLYGLFF